MNRRTAMKQIVGATATLAVAPSIRAFGEHGELINDRPTAAEREAMAGFGRGFMEQFFAPALSVAIVRNSKFVYEHAMGMAYEKDFQQCTSTSLFRIASATKPITSVAIFTLAEQGKLNLSDKVFGPSGILGDFYEKKPYKQYVEEITVDHLLTHTCGGWPADSTDPMFRDRSSDVGKLISWALENLPLTYPPGEHWAYSNFGYCLLGRVIEHVTGMTYQSYVQQAVLSPIGITDMKIAGNTLRERAPNEVEYLGQFQEKPYDMNVTRMDSDAGWIASPSDLARFLAHVGGTPTIPSILKPETIRIMTTPSPAYPQSSQGRYARGWMVENDGNGNWWHDGSLPGSTSIMVKTKSGMCWAALTNTRTQPEATINAALDQLVWNMVQQVPGWIVRSI
jgi:CubicO group peptidase (beta-lactamase class C family)